MGFAFARMARIVSRLERMRRPCRRQRRNAGGRPRPDLSGGGFRSSEARAQKLRHLRLVRNVRSALGALDQGLDLAHLRVRSYALFLDGNKIVDDRFAVQTDSCDLQAYYPFERMPTGLDPLH